MLYALLVLAAVLLLLIVFLFFIPFKIYIKYNNDFQLDIEIFGIKKEIYKSGKKQKKNKSAPSTQSSVKKEKSHESFCESLNKFKNTYTAVLCGFKQFKDKFVISLFKMDISFGTGDAAVTGILTGAAYAATYGTLTLANQFFTVNEQHINITPDFDTEHFNVDFNCIFTAKTIYAIITLIKVIFILKKSA